MGEVPLYRGTQRIRRRPPLGPYRRRFLMGEAAFLFPIKTI